MSRRADRIAAERQLDAAWLDEHGYKRCEHCKGLVPVNVSRCRRRKCPGYAPMWARDTMRKIRENLRCYGGLVAMCTLTAPGQDAGLVWDRARCHAWAEREVRQEVRVQRCWEGRRVDGVTETVQAAGRSLLNYVSRRLIAKSGVTMRVLRDVRLAWAWREGHLPAEVLDPFDLLHALCLLEQFSARTRAP